MVKKKIFLFVLTILFYNSLNAQWTVRKDGNGTATVNTNTAFIAGSSGNGNEIHGIGFTSSGAQSVTFKYSFTTVDPGFDYFFYTIDDGEENIITDDDRDGSINVILSNGQVFFMGINNFDGEMGSAQVSITYLLPPQGSSINLLLTNPIATLTSCLGSSSSHTTFGVTGSGLTASVTISAPTYFEISTSSGGTYSSSLTLTNTSTVSQTLYVRLNSSATAGGKTGTITATSTGASATTSVSGTVNAIPTISITESDASGSSNNDSKVCIGGLATLTASGGATYLWSTTALSASIIPSPSTNTTYTVTGTTAGCSNTASITITVETLPSLSLGAISLCAEATYLITKTTAVSNNDSWSVSGTITVNNGYVTAGTTPGTYIVSYKDGCAQTASATVTVATTSNLPAITDGLASYKFNNNPQGPIGSGNVNYVGYNGKVYFSQTRPIKTGFYKANNQSGNSAGCPAQFYIFRCTTCGTVSDNNNLSSVTIGAQVWTDKNLDVTTYRNGDPIPQVTDATAWANLTTGAWTYYNNDAANGAIYGKLYNWYALTDSRGLAPAGWHVPSDAEWTTLGNSLGGDEEAGGKMKSTGITYWISPNTGATNSSDFNGLPGGGFIPMLGFVQIGGFGAWWSTTIAGLENPILRAVVNDNPRLLRTSEATKEMGFSVRLVKD
jgi:uncharacterized protein (TIGR02145 family)